MSAATTPTTAAVAPAPGPGSRAEALHAATPPGRDRFVDLVRLLALVVVVAAHWVLVPLVADGTGALGRSPVARASTWGLMVMPLFFAVGGFVHVRALGGARPPSPGRFVLERADRLLGPVALLLVVWLALAAAVTAVAPGATAGPVGVGVDRATTPLWFVAVYLVVVLLAPLTVRLHRRHGLRAVAGGVLLVAGLDLVRGLVPGAATVAGTAQLLAVWLAVHQLGHLWGDGLLDRRRARGALAAAGWGSALVLTVGTGWYPVDMQGLPGSEASNFAPPTLALLAQGAGLLGTVLLLREPAARLLARPRAWAAVAAGGAVTMTVFCWHLTAAFAVWGVVLLLGTPVPAAATARWWALVPVWLLLCLPVLLLLVRLTGSAERRRLLLPPTPAGAVVPPARPRGGVVVVGTLAVAAATFVVSQVGVDGWTAGSREALLGAEVPVWPALLVLAAGGALLRWAGRPA